MEIVSLSFAVVSLGISIAVVLFFEKRRWLPRQYARRVIVHTTDDSSIEGTLVSTSPDGLVLRAAKLLDAQDMPLGGDVFIPSRNQHFIQLVVTTSPG